MNSLPSRTLFLTQADAKIIETSVVNVQSGSDQLVTRVNNDIIYVEGLTAVTKHTSNKAALAHHTSWARRVLNPELTTVQRTPLRQAA